MRGWGGEKNRMNVFMLLATDRQKTVNITIWNCLVAHLKVTLPKSQNLS